MKKASSAEPFFAPAGNSRSLWLGVAAGFLLLGLGWAVLVTVAHRAHIANVPLAQPAGDR